MSPKYVIGIDFGTESGRALLVDVADGREVATATHTYAHGVIDTNLPESDIQLPPDWALQDPNDYIAVLRETVPPILAQSGVEPADVIGIGIDFTSCTMLPTLADGTPLCQIDEYRHEPHAWVKLWKHHAAQPEADRMNQLAAERGEAWLDFYGGKVSSEWFFCKALQILDEAPHIYRAAERLIEAADWIVWQLIGHEIRSTCTAGYKALWQKGMGFPSREYFASLHPDFEDVVETKMDRELLPLGAKAGELTEETAALLGLQLGTAVAVGLIDAHATVPTAQATSADVMTIIMGTSNCHMLLNNKCVTVPGIAGVVEDGIIPGLFGYEAGQSAVGDIFAWFVENCVPMRHHLEAETQNLDIHTYVELEASKQRPGEHGLLALDWWNGNRSTLVDAELSGLIVGMTLATTAVDLYRALLESTAFGTRRIIEAFTENGIPIERIVAAGGLPERNELLMQIYADVTKREIRVVSSSLSGALGAAIHGAVAAGVETGGYANLSEASARIGGLKDKIYRPIPQNVEIYERLYTDYVRLYNYFGLGETGSNEINFGASCDNDGNNDVMKRLRLLR